MTGEYGTTVFCDDIRDEVTGKKTYVGVYGTEMVLNGTLPFVIPQFALAVTLLEPIQSASGPLNIKILMPGESGEQAVIDVELPVDRHANLNIQEVDPTAEYSGALMAFRISPLLIVAEGHIRVRAYKEGREIKLGALRIRLASPSEDDTGQ